MKKIIIMFLTLSSLAFARFEPSFITEKETSFLHSAYIAQTLKKSKISTVKKLDGPLDKEIEKSFKKNSPVLSKIFDLKSDIIYNYYFSFSSEQEAIDFFNSSYSVTYAFFNDYLNKKIENLNLEDRPNGKKSLTFSIKDDTGFKFYLTKNDKNVYYVLIMIFKFKVF